MLLYDGPSSIADSFSLTMKDPKCGHRDPPFLFGERQDQDCDSSMPSIESSLELNSMLSMISSVIPLCHILNHLTPPISSSCIIVDSV